MAYAGARVNVPTMVLLRPVLGIRGSYVPSAFNFLQLVGWTAFELWAMSWAANHVAKTMFGFDAYLLWLVIFAIICTAFALGGPIVVVRQWMEKFGIWVMTAASLWLTYSIVSSFNLGDVLSQTSSGGAPFWVGVDLVIAMPISWIPLIADYSRFGRSDKGAFAGSGLGYLLANIWFYALGILLVATVTLGDLSNPAVAIAGAILVFTAGWLALLATLAVETDQAFADIYSAAVTAQNVFTRIPQRVFVVIVAVIGLILASFLNMVTYEIFLLLIGSIFISLFGVMAADYFVVRRQEYETAELYTAGWQILVPGRRELAGAVLLGSRRHCLPRREPYAPKHVRFRCFRYRPRAGCTDGLRRLAAVIHSGVRTLRRAQPAVPAPQCRGRTRRKGFSSRESR